LPSLVGRRDELVSLGVSLRGVGFIHELNAFEKFTRLSESLPLKLNFLFYLFIESSKKVADVMSAVVSLKYIFCNSKTIIEF
jgi:hypothetical protein